MIGTIPYTIYGCRVCGRLWRTNDAEADLTFRSNVASCEVEGAHFHWRAQSAAWFSNQCDQWPENRPTLLEGDDHDAVEAAWRLGGEEAALALYRASLGVCPKHTETI